MHAYSAFIEFVFFFSVNSDTTNNLIVSSLDLEATVDLNATYERDREFFFLDTTFTRDSTAEEFHVIPRESTRPFVVGPVIFRGLFPRVFMARRV